MARALSVSQLGYTALHLALKNKQPAVVAKLMATDGIDLNVKTNKGFTPMLVAAWKGDIDAVQKLIKAGADINAKDTAGRNVWGVAHDWHKEEVRLRETYEPRMRTLRAAHAHRTHGASPPPAGRRAMAVDPRLLQLRRRVGGLVLTPREEGAVARDGARASRSTRDWAGR